MGKVKYIQRCRKPQKCGKCGKEIPVGSAYCKGELFRMPPIIRCTKCGLKHYEVTTSDYTRTVGRLVEDWEEDYPLGDGTIEEIVAVLEEVRDECQERLDNIPEQLQDGDAGTLLQERIDELDGVISDLECAGEWNDFLSEAYDELDEAAQNLIDAEQEKRKGANYEDFYFEFCKTGIEAAGEWQEAVEEKVREFISDALSNLYY